MSDKIILYHGTTHDFAEIDVGRGKPFKDFGPTANDDTRTSIRTVTNAANGDIMSDAALDLLITMLKPYNLPTQYYFGSGAATKRLEFKERSVV